MVNNRFLRLQILLFLVFIQFFADCLAQAVYAAYCEVFPRSYQLFDDDFKNFLLNTISEWVTGKHNYRKQVFNPCMYLELRKGGKKQKGKKHQEVEATASTMLLHVENQNSGIFTCRINIIGSWNGFVVVLIRSRFDPRYFHQN